MILPWLGSPRLNWTGLLQGLNLGCDKNFMAGSYSSGLIDDVRIYSRAVKP
jgi:hypothetical protein